MSILERKNLIEKLNKIYEPLFDGLGELQELKSQAESVINEIEDQLTNVGYDLDSLNQLIISQEDELEKIILISKNN